MTAEENLKYPYHLLELEKTVQKRAKAISLGMRQRHGFTITASYEIQEAPFNIVSQINWFVKRKIKNAASDTNIPKQRIIRSLRAKPMQFCAIFSCVIVHSEDVKT